MDEEHPRTEASINNRSHLRQILNIDGLHRKNKASLFLEAGRCTAKIHIYDESAFSFSIGSKLAAENIIGDYCEISHEGP